MSELPRFRAELPMTQSPRALGVLAAQGVGPRSLAGRNWSRSSRGFYRPASDGPTLPTQRILDVLPLLGSTGVIGGWAAAFVAGADWLDGINPYTGGHFPIDIISPALKRRSSARTRYRKGQLAEDDVVAPDDVAPITAPLRTTFDCGRWAPSLEESVVVLDVMIQQLRVVRSELTTYASEHHSLHGAAQVLEAARWAVPGIKSPWETRLRMCYCQQAGLPAPLVNQPIFDLDGQFLGEPDLFDPEAGLATEFDGEYHRERHQHRADNLREERLEEANVTVQRIDSLDLIRDRTPLVERIRRGYQRGTRRNRRLDSWSLDQPEWWRRRNE
ncbi:hypothetical protein FOE78_02630 [Microlunatus elymi]|uniref:DUF559 domain-containing protein n=1 Tax=Microlunatus elymi TaxID=2596828 RepID=A0A516PUU3_9ACTN|nr:hypothetical protein [Microlunatus elymi]QDP94957.1 hypothetical protein FOE78_02630 [Microlunatus elymi]